MCKIAIATIAECCNEESLTQHDKDYLSRFTSAKRRREVSAWRTLLRRTLCEIGEEEAARSGVISYDDVGAPYITNTELHIGVSHSSTHVAVVIDSKACAIDIESLDRNFERVASRYVTAEESELAGENPLKLPIIWSAKETLYKVAGMRELDLLTSLRVNHIDETSIIGEITPKSVVITMHYSRIDDHIVVHTL